MALRLVALHGSLAVLLTVRAFAVRRRGWAGGWRRGSTVNRVGIGQRSKELVIGCVHHHGLKIDAQACLHAHAITTIMVIRLHSSKLSALNMGPLHLQCGLVLREQITPPPRLLPSQHQRHLPRAQHAFRQKHLRGIATKMPDEKSSQATHRPGGTKRRSHSLRHRTSHSRAAQNVNTPTGRHCPGAAWWDRSVMCCTVVCHEADEPMTTVYNQQATDQVTHSALAISRQATELVKSSIPNCAG